MDAKEQKPESYTYAKAGVSIETGNALVRAIAPLAKSTRRAGADADLGGFGGFFDLKAAGFNDPLLVAANDGVGILGRLLGIIVGGLIGSTVAGSGVALFVGGGASIAVGLFVAASRLGRIQTISQIPASGARRRA